MKTAQSFTRSFPLDRKSLLGLYSQLGLRENNIIPEADLPQFLEKQGVPYQEWGHRPGTKSFESLLGSLRLGECAVESNGHGIVIHWHVAVAYVYHRFKHRQNEIFEHHQKLPSGQKIQRDFPGIGEKILAKETPEEAVRRGLGEELGQTEPLFKQPDFYTLFSKEEIVTEPAPSDWFRPLRDVYHRKIFTVPEIAPVLYRPEYHEARDGREIVFRWRVVKQ